MADEPRPGLFRAPSPRLPTPSETERALQLFVGNIDDYAIFLLDPTGRIASWNSGARKIKGYESHEIIGDRRLSKEAGFDHHLVKPVDPGILVPLIARHRAELAWTDLSPQYRGSGS